MRYQLYYWPAIQGRQTRVTDESGKLLSLTIQTQMIL